MMAQNRKAPAYQEYAATMLANRNFRLMTLAERGLFYTLRLECWENMLVPASKHELSKYLGYDVAELEKTLTANVKAFLLEKDGSFYCPELDDYRQHIEERKIKQSEGGKRGAALKNGKTSKPRKPVNAGDVAMPSSCSQLSQRDSLSSLVKPSTAKQSQNQSLVNGDIPITKNDEWVNDYDKASNG